MPSFWRHRTETPQGVGAGGGVLLILTPTRTGPAGATRPRHVAVVPGGGHSPRRPWARCCLRSGACAVGAAGQGPTAAGPRAVVGAHVWPLSPAPCAQGVHHSVLLRGRREHPGRRDVQVRVHLPRQGAGPEEEVCDLLQPVAGRHGGACAPRPGSVGLSGSPARVCVTP